MTAKYLIAIDLGGTNLKLAIFGPGYKMLKKKTFSTRTLSKATGKASPSERLISSLVSAVKELLKAHGLSSRQVAGMGIGVPGPVDYRTGIVHFLPNIPGWREVALSDILRHRLGIPVFLDNDAKLMALAEHSLGAARGCHNAICITLGTGVGAGIISDGRLYRGKSNATAEIGHVPINEKGPRCNCGGIACLEAYVSNARLLRKAGRLFGRPLSLEETSRLARRGNRKAQAFWSQAAGRIGIALSAVINLLNPESIVIGGGIAGAGRVLFDGIRKTVSQRAMKVQAKDVRIVRSRLGNDAGLIGAAIIAAERSRT